MILQVTAPGAPPLLAPKERSKHWKAFFLTLGIGILVFLPFVIMDRGYFIYYGDFNVQQIPFYKLAHEAIRSGDIFWSWKTDLGANFFGSYTFYLLFSPFFWLTLPFPTWVLPYLMAPLLILKTACAALTSFLYIRRFVRKQDNAVIASVLYAFSGWMSFNVFFNHFHEVAVFFPLLLLAVEKLITENKIGYVAVAVAINAMVNYWFFIGEAVFVILYVIVRTYSKNWRITLRKFIQLAVESVAGVLLAAGVLLPSALALMGNPRTGADRLLSGWGFWIYWHNFNENGSYPQRIYAILASLIFPPDSPARPNMFPNHGAKWASLSAWLPLFGLTGVFAYFNQKRWKKDWVRKLLGLSLFFSLIPGLNSLFILLNNSYYARWFYMPILLMVLATARALEQSAYSEEDQKAMQTGLKWMLIISTVFIVAVGLTPNMVDGQWVFGLAEDVVQAWVWYLVVLLGILYLAWLVIKKRHSEAFQRYLTAGLAVIIVAFNVGYIAMGKQTPSRSTRVIETAIEGKSQIYLPDFDDEFARADIYDDMDNMLMFWGVPNIQAFHSIVPVSIMEFYPKVGVKRDVGSRPEAEYYALRSLLSVRWLYIQQDKEEQEPMPGYSFYTNQLDYRLYENNYFLPMGFSYDYYITPEEFDTIPSSKGANALLRGIYLEEEAVARHQDILSPLPALDNSDFTEQRFFRDVEDRQEFVATDFATDTQGFTAKTNFPTSRLVFFSVPYEGGWSAKINGETAKIEKANIGFMAVRVPAGEVEIRFDYMTPGLKVGIFFSGITALLLLAVMLFTISRRRKTKGQLRQERQRYLVETTTVSWDEYLGDTPLVQQELQDYQRQLYQQTPEVLPEMPKELLEVGELSVEEPPAISEETLGWEDSARELSTKTEEPVENLSQSKPLDIPEDIDSEHNR